MGHEMSGVIESVGPGVSGWSAGDRVTVRPLDPCGACPACRAGHSHICHNLKFIGIDTPGALQGLWTVPAHTLHRLPDALPLREAAMIEPVAVACHDVRMGEVRPGEHAVVTRRRPDRSPDRAGGARTGAATFSWPRSIPSAWRWPASWASTP